MKKELCPENVETEPQLTIENLLDTYEMCSVSEDESGLLDAEENSNRGIMDKDTGNKQKDLLNQKNISINKKQKDWNKLLKVIPTRDWIACIFYMICGSRTNLCKTLYKGDMKNKSVVGKKIDELNTRVKEAIKKYDLLDILIQNCGNYIDHSGSYITEISEENIRTITIEQFINNSLPDAEKAMLLMRVISISRSKLAKNIYGSSSQKRVIVSIKIKEIQKKLNEFLKESLLFDKSLNILNDFINFSGSYHLEE